MLSGDAKANFTFNKFSFDSVYTIQIKRLTKYDIYQK